MKHILAFVLIAMVSGCGTLATTVPPPEEPKIPANMLVICPDIPMLEFPAPPGVTMKYIVALQQQYSTCATRNDSLQDAATKPKK